MRECPQPPTLPSRAKGRCSPDVHICIAQLIRGKHLFTAARPQSSASKGPLHAVVAAQLRYHGPFTCCTYLLVHTTHDQVPYLYCHAVAVATRRLALLGFIFSCCTRFRVKRRPAIAYSMVPPVRTVVRRSEDSKHLAVLRATRHVPNPKDSHARTQESAVNRPNSPVVVAPRCRTGVASVRRATCSPATCLGVSGQTSVHPTLCQHY
jgi:hypothetical protein